MQGMAGLVAHQREAAGEHAAVGEGGEQLSGVNDAGVVALHQVRQRAAGAFDQPLRAFAFAGDPLALSLRVGEF